MDNFYWIIGRMTSDLDVDLWALKEKGLLYNSIVMACVQIGQWSWIWFMFMALIGESVYCLGRRYGALLGSLCPEFCE